ncbi:MAG: type II toxin-antitoxin system RelE/ParE family toxin [bacterium]
MRKDQKKIITEIEQLASSPLEKSNVKKLINSPHYRLRVGNYYLQVKEIVEDFLDHLHTESILEDTKDNDWVDLQVLKNELGIK